MKYLYFFSVCLLGLFTTIDATLSIKKACLEKKRALELLETVSNYLEKAKLNFPSCVDNEITSDDSECDGKDSLAYIETSRNMVTDIRNNFPSCDDYIDYNFVCSDILASGKDTSGIYTIWLGETYATRKQVQAYCDMDTDGGGWTVIQRRGKYSNQVDFDLDWESYKNGFGNIAEEFWFGNENIRVLCHKGCKVRFDLVSYLGQKGYGIYQNFNLSRDDYRISISDFSGDIKDGMGYHNNCAFSTKDHGRIETAKRFKSGWWHMDNTWHVNLNGVYRPQESAEDSVTWWIWEGIRNLNSAEIKVKPN